MPGELDLCDLCRIREDTYHLFMECESYSQPIWLLLDDILTYATRLTDPGHSAIESRFQNILYNQEIATLPSAKARFLTNILIQEIKRHIVYRRMQRVLRPGLSRLIYNHSRIAAHLSIVIQKTSSLLRYQGKNVTWLENMLTETNALI